MGMTSRARVVGNRQCKDLRAITNLRIMNVLASQISGASSCSLRLSCGLTSLSDQYRSIEQQTTHRSSQMHETSITTNVEAMLDSRSPYVNTLCNGKFIITIGIVKIVEFGR